jgi:NAD(P)-dependent dehydrogenase (short-subunit alcohol dehydrogenase family)
LIAGEDLAAVAAKVLAEGPDAHAGQGYWLSTDVFDGKGIADALTSALGRSIAAEIITPDDLRAAIGTGVLRPPAFMETTYALSTLEWLQQLYDGRMDRTIYTTTTVEDLLSRPPTHLEDWAALHRAALLTRTPPAPLPDISGTRRRPAETCTTHLIPQGENAMDLRLTDQVIVVTGAASGIGQATARLLSEEGAVVVGVDRDPVDAGPGARATAVQADLTDPATPDPATPDPATPDRVIATVLERRGRIDALVNDAGGLQARTSFLDITDKQWLAAFDLNFHVARRMSRGAVPAMLDSGDGSLVHVGSDSGRLPEVGNQDYAAAKLALLALSKSLATEFSPRGIRSNVVVPGPTHPAVRRPGGFGDQAAELWGIDKESAITRMVTQIRPLLTHKMGQPDDIAQVIAYLVSPLSRQVTAAEWTVDGGALRQV